MYMTGGRLTIERAMMTTTMRGKTQICLPTEAWGHREPSLVYNRGLVTEYIYIYEQ